MPTTPALQIQGLSKTFTGQRALIDVDLELQPGEVRALVGALPGIDWSKPLGAWSKDQIVHFLIKALQLLGSHLGML
jgi:ABC-type phosphonate transport system ATPase subunit